MATNSTYAPPLARVTPNDHRAPLWCATLICLVCVVLGVLTRLWVRFKALGLDDFILLGAFAVALAEFVTVIAGLVRGLGQSDKVLTDATVDSMGQVFLATEGLFIVALYIVKASVLSTIERVLGPDQKIQRLICWIMQGVAGLCGVASLIVVLVSCEGSAMLTRERNNQCPAQATRWIAITIVDAILELGTFGLFCLCIQTLQMQKRLKMTVTLLLAFRLGCIAFAAVHAEYVHAYETNGNPGIGVVGALVWQQLSLAYSLVAALLIALKGFLQSFDIRFGNDQTYAHNSHSRSAGDRYNLKVLSGKGSKFGSKLSQKDRQQQSLQDGFHNSATAYSTKVYHGSNEREGSVESGISQHPIIRYDIEYTVTSEEKPSRGTGDS